MSERTTATKEAPILVVEDEPSISDAVCYALAREGFRVRTASDGPAAVEQFRAEPPLLVLLDLMLPGMPGLDVCRLIRSESMVPIVMVTAKDNESDKVVSFEIGADDYITKPFSMAELVSRVRAHVRRASMVGKPVETRILSAGPVEMDLLGHSVTVRGNPVLLPPKEFALLRTLIRNTGRVLQRDSLMTQVWGPNYFGDTRTLDVHIKRLRAKLGEDPGAPRHLKTIRGVGYKFEVAEEPV